MFKELICKLKVNDIKFDYFIRQLNVRSFTDKINNVKPCIGCGDYLVCSKCKHDSTLMTRGGIVFVAYENENYIQIEFILKLLSCMNIDYSNIGYTFVKRNTSDDYIESSVCSINNINAEDDLFKPTKYICLSDKAYHELLDMEYKIVNDTITINNREVPFIRVIDLEILLNDYENSKVTFVKQIINALKE